jgi:hypothetical protein
VIEAISGAIAERAKCFVDSRDKRARVPSMSNSGWWMSDPRMTRTRQNRARPLSRFETMCKQAIGIASEHDIGTARILLSVRSSSWRSNDQISDTITVDITSGTH